MITEEDEETTVTTFLSKFSDEEIRFLIDFLEHVKNQRQELKIPLSIFSNPALGILESLVKFLKENRSMSFKEIADALGRDQRTVWTSYHSTLKKRKRPFVSTQKETDIPLSIFCDRTKSPMQSLVLHLHHNLLMKFKEIASLIKRDYRTVWLSHKKACKKRGKG